MKRKIVLKGGAGSGNFGHSGRPGKVGGSTAGKYTVGDKERTTRRLKAILKGKGVEKIDIKKAPDSSKMKWVDDDAYNVTDVNGAFQAAGFKGDAFDVIHTAFEMKDEASGLESKVRFVYTLGTGVTVSGAILNADGEEVGNFTRKFTMKYPNGWDKPPVAVVEHDYFSMDKEYRGSGFATKFYKQSELTYMQAGVQQIQIHANISVGGYAWARMGFNADSADLDKLKTRVIQSYGLMPNAPDFYSNDWYSAVSLVNAANSTWELAALQHNGVAIGKAGMLGSDWSATKNLDMDDEGFLVGQLYYMAKGQ